MIFNEEKVKRDVKRWLDEYTGWTKKPQQINLERNEETYFNNFLARNTQASLLIRTNRADQSLFLGYTGGFETVSLTIEVFCQQKTDLESIANDVLQCMHDRSFDGGYVHVIPRGTTNDSTQYRELFRLIMDFEIKTLYEYS